VSLDDLETALKRWMPRLLAPAALLAVRQAARFRARLLTPEHPFWPTGLADLEHHGPIALWVRGNDEALEALGNSIALVGARAATGYGEHVTMEASAGLVDRGFAIVSGAAYGIDGMAHRAALASSGQTVAFLAGGVDRFYPSGHDALLTRIVEAGAVISELPCGAPPTKWRFLQRNRLIAAVSQATVVLEAGWRSGSLNTANHAAALGRPLGAVPGPVTSAASAGCHRLIRDYQATLVTNPDEMAELMPALDASTHSAIHTTLSGAFQRSAPRPSPEYTRLLDALSTRSPRTSVDLATRSGLSVGDVQALLGTLELDGVVAERERGWVAVTRLRD
jgi:DNA processing protein